MRKLSLTLALSILTLSAFSQINLSVNLLRSQSTHDIAFTVDTLKIYKESRLFKTISHPKSLALFEPVPQGKYTFVYNNLFGERVERAVELNEANNTLGGQDVNLFVDQLIQPKTTYSSLNTVKDSEAVIIKIAYSGCYNTNTDSLKIFKKRNALFFYSTVEKKEN